MGSKPYRKAIGSPGPDGVVRKMTNDELKCWTRAIHKACSPEWIPALRFAFANLMPFVDEGCPTAYTDCHYRIGLSPDMLDPDKTTDEQLAIVILHETLHNVQQHARRFEGIDVPGLVRNYVTDFEINSIIASSICNIDLKAPVSTGNRNIHWDWLLGEVIEVETQDQADELNAQFRNAKRPILVGEKTFMGVLLPGIGAFWDIPPGLTAEQYLSLIDYEFTSDGLSGLAAIQTEQADGSQGGSGAAQASQTDHDQGGSGTAQSGQTSSDQNGSKAAQASHAGNEPGSSEKGTTVRIYQNHADGSETTLANEGDLVDRLDGDADLDSWKSVDDLGIHPMERGLENEVRERVAHDIDEYRRMSRAGNLPLQAVLNYVSQALRPPVVNWQKILRQVSRKASQEMTAGRQDYTYRKRRRRSGGAVSGLPDPVEVIYPGQMAYIPRIRFAIDTSGSMSKNEYRKALSEAEGIIREFSTSIETVCIDAEAGEVLKVNSVEEITSNLTGGGGTDMVAALRQVAEQKPHDRPDVLIIATDGVFNWNRFVDALTLKGLEKTAVIVLSVYDFDMETYYSKQKSITKTAQLMSKHKRNAYFVQAWVD